MKKYILYAVGEIALVVIGILIALSINNWNNSRIDDKQEGLILKQLSIEFQNNLDQLRDKIGIREEMIKSCKILIDMVDGSTRIMDTDSIDFHISRTLIAPTFDPSLEVTSEMISSGKLYLLSNPQLRSDITRWPGIVKDVSKDENQQVNFTMEEYFPFLIQHYKVRNILIALESDILAEKYKSKPTAIDLRQTSIDNNQLRTLLSNPELEDYISTILYYCHFLNDELKVIATETENLLSFVQQEVKMTH